ncbi:hypothetical protein Kisp01_31470 [Kineosporia sp. NBRC 101677]|nr:hypothetical protein Kisp01_31470 [Kineosporia sp. NBRC 101677]
MAEAGEGKPGAEAGQGDLVAEARQGNRLRRLVRETRWARSGRETWWARLARETRPPKSTNAVFRETDCRSKVTAGRTNLAPNSVHAASGTRPATSFNSP